ncbi:hypothetical protein VTO42DRAFT_1237 [Malbranchea cinnamomea]
MSIPTGSGPLPEDAIQRVLFVCNPVHVYAIPPLTSMKGYTAADWTTPDPRNGGKTRQIFTARLRIVETAIPVPSSTPRPGDVNPTDQEKVTADILLEDPDNGNLFAAAPYTDEGVVEHVVDSSRFFALRVVGDGRKAVLGIGFEDRSEAFDFGVTLQEVRKVLGFGKASPSPSPCPSSSSTSFRAPNGSARPLPPRGVSAPGGPIGIPMRGPPGRMRMPPSGAPGVAPHQRQPPPEPPAKPRDFSLKPGQTITVNIGGRKPAASSSDDAKGTPSTIEDEKKALFSIPPPPGPTVSKASEENSTSSFPLIPPPQSAREARGDRRRKPPERSVEETSPNRNEDDEEFGEFQ